MNIVIFGNGKMGKIINKIATERGHDIIATSSSNNPGKDIILNTADMAIDFSTPKSALENITHAINNGIPIVSGTTGWLEKLEKVKKLCIKKNGAFLYSANFSVSMNIFFKLNKDLAELIKPYNYNSSIHEIHHKEKLDSPSGTAKKLARDIQKKSRKDVPIKSERIDNVTGEHQVTYDSLIDKIEIKHSAKNREGFAIGAIMAAEWLLNKKGVFSMKDLL